MVKYGNFSNDFYLKDYYSGTPTGSHSFPTKCHHLYLYNDAAPFTSIDLQAGGATQGGFNYYVSGNIHSQDGIALNSDYKRYTLRTQKHSQYHWD